MGYYHIQRYLFDVTTGSEVNARPLQNKLSRMFNHELSAQLEQLFDRVIPADIVLQLPQLIVDAGIIPYELIDNTLVPRIIALLEEQLSELLAMNMQAGILDSSAQTFPAVMADLSGLLEYYLLYGVFPWWSKSLQFSSVADVVEQLISSNAARFKALILRVGVHAHVQRRLALQFKEGVIRKIIRILEPDEAEFIFQYHQDVLNLQQQKSLVKEELHSFGRIVWEFIFRTLLTHTSGRFNRKMFVRSNIAAIAAYFNLSYTQILEMLNTAGSSPELRASHFELFSLIGELWDEQAAIDPEPVVFIETGAAAAYSADIFKQQLDIIYHYLVHASLPVAAKIEDISQLNDILLRLIRATPGAVKEMLQVLGRLENPGARMAGSFNEQVIIQIIRLAEPVNADFILEYQAAVNKIQERERPVNIEQGAFSKAVWELILNFLFTEHASEFNRRVFLEKNIRGIAARYNLRLADFVNTLRQQARLLINSSFLNLFFSVLDTFQAIAIVRVENSAGSDSGTESASKNSTPQDEYIFYRDALLYLLAENKLPQWYHTNPAPWYRNNLSPQQILLLLAAGKVAYLLQLLAFSEKYETYRLNLMQHVPQAALLKAFAGLNGGGQAVKLYNHMVQLLPVIPQLGLSTEQLSVIAFNSFWQAYSRGGWQSLDPVFFLKTLIRQLAFSVAVAERVIFNLVSQAARIRADKQDLEVILAEIGPATKGYEFTGELFTQGSWTEKEWLASVLQKTAEEFFQKAGQSPPAHPVAVAAFILEYFIKHNKFPSALGLSATQAATLLRHIIRVLLQKNPGKLKAIMGMAGSTQARIQLHNIFWADDTRQDAAVRAFLETYLEADLINYLSEVIEIPQGQEREAFWRLVDKLFLNPAAITDQQKVWLLRISRQQRVARFLAERYTDAQVYQLISLQQQHWRGSNVAAFLNDVTRFFQLAFTTISDTFGARLRAFNMMYFWGSSHRPSAEDYMRKLFDNFSYYLGTLTDAQLEKLIEANIVQGSVSPEFYSVVLLLKTALKRQHQLLSGRRRFEKMAETSALVTRTHVKNETIHEELRQRKEDVMETEEVPETPFPEGESFMVSNAGLVILHPFLFTYFNRLGMLENREFKNEALRRRAVHLLQHLAGFNDSLAENELLLNKILVGLPPEEPVDETIMITETEKEISEQLLNVVTQQWDKLKNTSAGGFQASFLQRQGSITAVEGDWQLRVEARAYDLLLQTLPWGIGLIKLPWMVTMLQVQWEVN